MKVTKKNLKVLSVLLARIIFRNSSHFCECLSVILLLYLWHVGVFHHMGEEEEEKKSKIIIRRSGLRKNILISFNSLVYVES
jgi:hypothetical protein